MAACGQMYVLWGRYMILYRNVECSGVGGLFRLRMCMLVVYGTGESVCFGEVAYAVTIIILLQCTVNMSC